VGPFLTNHGPGVPSLATTLSQDPLVLRLAMPALTNLFVSIENTGSAAQFADKFNVRHAVAVLASYLLSKPPHQQQVLRLCGLKACLFDSPLSST